MRRYYVTSLNAGRFQPVEVVARTEADARTIAMVHYYGDKPDRVTPHAPGYYGLGLQISEIEEVKTYAKPKRASR